jgi:hypothetical protein
MSNMNILEKKYGNYSLGIWFSIIALGLLLFVGMGGQAYSLIDWDGAVDAGLQNERFLGDAEEKTWAKAAESEAKADMVWFLPILIIAFIGVLRRTLYGYTAGMMGLAIGVYFSTIFAYSRWDTYRETVYHAILIFTIPSFLGIIGLWTNKEYFNGISLDSSLN